MAAAACGQRAAWRAKAMRLSALRRFSSLNDMAFMERNPTATATNGKRATGNEKSLAMATQILCACYIFADSGWARLCGVKMERGNIVAPARENGIASSRSQAIGRLISRRRLLAFNSAGQKE